MSWHDLFDGSDAHLLPRGISECADYLRRHNAWRRGDDSIESPDPHELGLNIDFAIAIIDAIAGRDHLMVIAAFRYCLGRMTYIVASFQKMVLYVSQSPEHDEYMQSVCECAVRWADMMIKVKK